MGSDGNILADKLSILCRGGNDWHNCHTLPRTTHHTVKLGFMFILLLGNTLSNHPQAVTLEEEIYDHYRCRIYCKEPIIDGRN